MCPMNGKNIQNYFKGCHKIFDIDIYGELLVFKIIDGEDNVIVELFANFLFHIELLRM